MQEVYGHLKHFTTYFMSIFKIYFILYMYIIATFNHYPLFTWHLNDIDLACVVMPLCPYYCQNYISYFKCRLWWPLTFIWPLSYLCKTFSYICMLMSTFNLYKSFDHDLTCVRTFPIYVWRLWQPLTCISNLTMILPVWVLFLYMYEYYDDL